MEKDGEKNGFQLLSLPFFLSDRRDIDSQTERKKERTEREKERKKREKEREDG